MKKLSLVVLALAVMPLLLPAEPVRAGKIAAAGQFSLGETAHDPSAIAGVSVEYGLLENLGLGAGWAYFDGYLIQAQCIEAHGRWYVLAGPLTPFVEAAGYLPVAFDAVYGSVKAGAQWQSPWVIFVEAFAILTVEPAGAGYALGGTLGLRL